MKKSQLIGWPIFILALGFATSCYGNEERDPAHGHQIADIYFDLFKKMSKEYQGNFLMSPISISLAVAVLGESDPQNARKQSWMREQILNQLTSLQSVGNESIVKIGSRIFVDRKLQVIQEYADAVKSFNGVDFESTNFRNSRAAASSINNWFSDMTRESIKKIVSAETVKRANMLITNALYFQGAWEGNIFQPRETMTRKFHTTAGKSVDALFMAAHYNFFDYSQASATEIFPLPIKVFKVPYAGNKYAMYLIVPHTVDGLEAIVQNLNASALSKIESRISFVVSQKVWIPKFKFGCTTSLKSTFKKMGYSVGFDDTEFASGMVSACEASGNPVLSDIVQTAQIEVTEIPKIAFTATETYLTYQYGGEEELNHPFLFYIKEVTSGTVLLMGSVSNPLEGAACTATPNVSGRIVFPDN